RLSTTDIVAEIVKLLEPLRLFIPGKDFPFPPEQPGWLKDDIPNQIRRLIEALQPAAPEAFERSAIREERMRAREVIDAIDELASQFKNAPRDLKLDSPIADYHPDSHPARLFAELKHVRDRCEAIERDTLTAGRKDQVKQACANMALFIIRMFSLKEP